MLPSNKKPPRSKAAIEAETNEIFRLVVAGASGREIQQLRRITQRTYEWHMRKLEEKLADINMGQRNSFILMHKEITKERLLRDKRVFETVMQDDRTVANVKVEAARADAEVNITLFKLENETALFVNTIRQQQTDVLRLDSIASRQARDAGIDPPQSIVQSSAEHIP